MTKETSYHYALEINDQAPLKQELFLKLWRFLPGKRSIQMVACDQIRSLTDPSARSVFGQYETEFALSSHPVGLILPRSSYVVRFLDLPRVSRRELRTMIKLQMGHMLPYDVNDIVYDFQELPKTGNAQTRIAVFIMTKSVMDQYLSYFNLIRTAPVFVYPATMVIANAYGAAHPAARTGTCAIIDNDGGMLELIVLNGGMVALSQNFTFDPEQMQQSMTQVVHMLQKVVPAADKLTAVLYNEKLTGVALMMAIKNTFPQAAGTLVDAAALTRTGVVTAKVEAAERSISSGYGLAVSNGKLSVNLLPDSVVFKKDSAECAREVMRTIISAALLLLAIVLFFVSDIVAKHMSLAALDGQIAAIRSEALEARQVVDGVAMITEAQMKKQIPPLVLQEIYQMVPDNVFLTFFDCSAADGVKVRGMARQFSDVSNLVLKMQGSQYLEGVEMKFAKKRMEYNEEFTDFQIDALIKADVYGS